MFAKLLPLLFVGACATSIPASAPSQPRLAQLAAPYAEQLRWVGITRLTSTGNDAMVRLETLSGPVYVPYPREMPPVAFVLDVNPDGLSAFSVSFEETRDASVLAALLPAAIRETASNNAFVWLRANPWH